MLVLSVIGVIAALTLPGIIQSTNDKIMKTKWKKAYNTIIQATRMQLAKEESINVTTIKNICLFQETAKQIQLFRIAQWHAYQAGAAAQNLQPQFP